MIAGTKQALERAWHAGADRLHGAPLPPGLKPRPTMYELKAVDSKGRVYFRRELHWSAYIEAVTYWQQLGTPNRTLVAEDAA
ncbi:MAG TPA: hypothetical protein VKX25_19570 [Bryobacteraceae bacterium]|jgi:hypothetical protein|nr:hypothetical protein [Bryobacteraceae bacterium]